MARLAGRASPLLLLCALAACGGGAGQRPYANGSASYSYTPPGPPEDPWGPYIHEAAQRFSVPERWIRAVMHQESGGHEYLHGQPITSDAGATGLMQVMPATYAELRAQYNLGDDPYNPHDNIMAGTAYIREMYDRYGSPAFLAAYNAGPQRVEDYNAGRSALPNETVNYLASIAPHLGTEVAMTGPLAVYGQGGVASPDPVPRAYASAPIAGCWRDPDAAYDPDAPCRSAPAPIQVASYSRAAPSVPLVAASSQAGCWHDPNAAYDPGAPCQTPPPAPPPVEVAFAPPLPTASVQGARPSSRAGCWHDPDAAYDPSAPCQAPPVAVASAAPASSSAAPTAYAAPAASYPVPAQMPTASAGALPAPVPYQAGGTSSGRYLWGNAAQVARASQPPVADTASSARITEASRTNSFAATSSANFAAPIRARQTAPAASMPVRVASAAPAPQRSHHSFANYLIPQAAASELPPPRGGGGWSIQVGAFATADLARSNAANARAMAPRPLTTAHTVVGTTSPFGGHVLYRARLAGLSAENAQMACSVLIVQRQACVTVPPGG